MKLVSIITEKAGLKQAVNILGRMKIGLRVVIQESAFDSCGEKNKMMEAIVKVFFCSPQTAYCCSSVIMV